MGGASLRPVPIPSRPGCRTGCPGHVFFCPVQVSSVPGISVFKALHMYVCICILIHEKFFEEYTMEGHSPHLLSALNMSWAVSLSFHLAQPRPSRRPLKHPDEGVCGQIPACRLLTCPLLHFPPCRGRVLSDILSLHLKFVS